MLSAEALRLAAIEVLCPTAAIEAGTGFPTLAGERVFDSRAAAVSEIDGGDERGYTPVLSLYTGESQEVQRGDAADENDYECQTTLEIVAELAVVARDDSGEFVDALAGTDAQAHSVLTSLTSQVSFLLKHSQAGFLFREFAISIRRIEKRPFVVPDLGLRWQRVTMRMTVAIPADRFDYNVAGLPEPVKSLQAKLPVGSYAKAKLAELAACFVADPRPALEEITIYKTNEPGFDPDTASPIATTGALDG